MKQLKYVASGIAVLALAMAGAGCATKTQSAIESRELETSVKMSETIFLEPVEPEKRVVWVHVRNTSDRQDIDPVAIENYIEKQLKRRGYKISDNPLKAYYRLQANVLYADHEREGLTEEGMLLGAVGGGILGSTVGGGQTSQTAGAVVGAVAGAIAGGLAGSYIHVDKYMLVVDVNIAEKVPGGVTRHHSGGASVGKVQRDQQANTKSDYLNYQTRVVGTAKKTNLQWEEAQPVLLDKFAKSLGGIF